MNKALSVLVVVAFAVLFLFGCTQSQDTTKTNTPSGSIVDENVAGGTVNSANIDSVVTQADSTIIPDTSSVDVGSIVDLN